MVKGRKGEGKYVELDELGEIKGSGSGVIRGESKHDQPDPLPETDWFKILTFGCVALSVSLGVAAIAINVLRFSISRLHTHTHTHTHTHMHHTHTHTH